MEHRRVCFRMLSLLPLVQISKLSQANSLLFGKVCCRTPRGVRGLKYLEELSGNGLTWSHPSRGAWIEIYDAWPLPPLCLSSHPSRGAWIEMKVSQIPVYTNRKSHPSRGAWIEILASRSASPGSDESHPSRGAWIEIVYL